MTYFQNSLTFISHPLHSCNTTSFSILMTPSVALRLCCTYGAVMNCQVSWSFMLNLFMLDNNDFIRRRSHVAAVFCGVIVRLIVHVLVNVLTVSILAWWIWCMLFFCCFFFSLYMFHIGWTLTTDQLLKHLKMYFVEH